MEHSEHEGVANVIQGSGEELGRPRESNEVKLSIKHPLEVVADSRRMLITEETATRLSARSLVHGVHWEGVIHRNKGTKNSKPTFLCIVHAVFKYAVSLKTVYVMHSQT